MLGSPQPGTQELAHLVEAMTGAPQRPGNRVESMHNGVTLDAMLDAISRANRTIDFSSYIYWPGPTAERFSDELAERAGAGVNVTWWSTAASASPVGWESPTSGPGTPRTPTTGETHLRIEGPALRELYGAFPETWSEAMGEMLANDHIPERGAFQDGVDDAARQGDPGRRRWANVGSGNVDPRSLDLGPRAERCGRRPGRVRRTLDDAGVSREIDRQARRDRPLPSRARRSRLSLRNSLYRVSEHRLGSPPRLQPFLSTFIENHGGRYHNQEVA